jgi:hypothetical protein
MWPPHLKPHSEVRKNSGQSNPQDGNMDGPSSSGCSAFPDNGENSSQGVNLNDNSDDNFDENSDEQAWAMEWMATTPNESNFDRYGTPWPMIFRRWIMSLVDHFTSIQILEWACVKLPKSEEISFSILGMDHQKTNLLDWETMKTMIHQLTPAADKEERDTFIAELETSIIGYENSQGIPRTAAQYRDSVLLPFQQQLKPNPNHSSNPEVVASCLHCEATLVAVMAYLATDLDHPINPLFEACPHL